MPEPYGSGTIDIQRNIRQISKFDAFRGDAADTYFASGLTDLQISPEGKRPK